MSKGYRELRFYPCMVNPLKLTCRQEQGQTDSWLTVDVSDVRPPETCMWIYENPLKNNSVELKVGMNE